jgi:hypothetical protein
MKYQFPLLLLAMGFVPTTLCAQDSIDKIVKKFEAKFEPAEAKPGQLVTLKINLELADGWQTYPTIQTDKAVKSSVNKFTFPTTGPAIFVGEIIDPPDPKSKADAILGFENMLYYPGGGTWEQKVVISPKAKSGETESKISVRLLVCDKDTCLPPEKFDLTAKIKVLDTKPVEIDPKYKAEVEKKLEK